MGLHPPAPLEPRAGAGALPRGPSRAVELLRLWIMWGAWFGDSLRCLVCVFWVLATMTVQYGGCRVGVVGHHGQHVCSEANPAAPGLSVAVFYFSWSFLLNLQCQFQVHWRIVLLLGDTC